MSDCARAPSFQDQITCPAGRRGYFGVRISLDDRQRTSRCDFQFKLLLLALASVRQAGNKLQPGPQLSDRFGKTRLCYGLAARAAPVLDRLLEEACFGEMVS